MKISIEISGSKELIPNITKENLILMIESYGLKSSILVVKKKKAIVNLKITSKVDGVELSCPSLNKKTNIPIGATLNDVFASILMYLGYYKATITNITVKNQSGLKIKPVIEIFAKKTFVFELPSNLQYLKSRENTDILNLSGDSCHKEQLSEKSQIFFFNEVLTSLLNVTDLCVFSDSKRYNLRCVSGLYYIFYDSNEKLPFVPNYLSDHSILEDLKKHSKIYMNHSEFRIFFTPNYAFTSSDRNLFTKLLLNKNIPTGLKKFLEHVPRYQDERDEIVQDLFEYFNTNVKGLVSRKGAYLNIEEPEYVESKNKVSIKYFRSQHQ